MAQITASIVSHGQGPLIDQLLGDLRQHAATSLERIVITLNKPEAWHPPSAVAGVPTSVFRNTTPTSFAANHNRAFSACESTVFAVLNPDLRLPRDPFPALLEAMGDTKCGLAVPWQVDGQGALEDFRRKLPTPLALLRRAVAMRRGVGRSITPTADLDWVAGAFMGLRSEAFRQLGGFDDRYRLYCEDVDLCIRLQLAGWQIAVLEGSVVVHDARRGSARSLQHLGWHLGSFLRLWTSRPFWTYLKSR